MLRSGTDMTSRDYARPSVTDPRRKAFKALVDHTGIGPTLALDFTSKAPSWLNKAIYQGARREMERRARVGGEHGKQ